MQHQRKSINNVNSTTQAQGINPSTTGPRLHNRFSVASSSNYLAHHANPSASGQFGASNGGISGKYSTNGNNNANSRSKENVHHHDFTKSNKQRSALYGHQPSNSIMNSGVPEPISTATGTKNAATFGGGAPIKNSHVQSGAISARSYGNTNNALTNNSNAMNQTNAFQQTQPVLQEVALYEIENRGQTTQQNSQSGTNDVTMEATQTISLGGAAASKRTTTYLPRKTSHEKFTTFHHHSFVNNCSSTRNRPGTGVNRSILANGQTTGSTKVQSNSMGHRQTSNKQIIQSKLHVKKTQLVHEDRKRNNQVNQTNSQQQSHQNVNTTTSTTTTTTTCPPAIINQDMQQQLMNGQNNSMQQDQCSANSFCQLSKDTLQSINLSHPSLHLDRKLTSDVDRQNVNVNCDYGQAIDKYMRQLEEQTLTVDSLIRHKVTPALRARMIDWMIEVLTNFKCDDQTFFLAVALLDRYFKGKQESHEISDLHIIGVTVMFIASKYEDIYPLKMKMVYEKIAHKKLPIERIKGLELEILKVINYKIAMPTPLDFLRVYLKEVLNIGHAGKTSIKKEKKDQPEPSSDTPEGLQILVQKMSLYLSKMAMHDYDLSGKKPSLLAVGSLYVALKICEQLKKTTLISNDIVKKLVAISASQEDDIIAVSQRVLYLAQNFDKAFPGLENLKKTHFTNITQLL